MLVASSAAPSSSRTYLPRPRRRTAVVAEDVAIRVAESTAGVVVVRKEEVA